MQHELDNLFVLILSKELDEAVRRERLAKLVRTVQFSGNQLTDTRAIVGAKTDVRPFSAKA